MEVGCSSSSSVRLVVTITGSSELLRVNLEAFNMTAKELAEMLSGREYGMEITKEEERQAAAAKPGVV